MRPLSARTLIGLCFVLMVLFIHQQFPRFVERGSELLSNADFSDQLEGWQLSGQDAGSLSFSGAEVLLINNKSENSLTLRQTVVWPENISHLQVSAELRSVDILPGDRSWYLGRLVLARYDQDGHWLNLPHYVADLTGTNPWQGYSTTFSADPRAESTQLILQLPHATGSLWAQNLSLHAAEPNSNYRYGQILAFCLGGGFLVFLLRRSLCREKQLLIRCGLFLTSSAILVGTLMPVHIKSEIKGQAGTFIHEIQAALSTDIAENQDHDFPDFMVSSDKLLHFAGFLIFSVFLCALQLQPFIVIQDVFWFACTTEVLQLFVEGRIPFLNDVLIDVAGGLTGLFCVYFLARIKRNRNLTLNP